MENCEVCHKSYNPWIEPHITECVRLSTPTFTTFTGNPGQPDWTLGYSFCSRECLVEFVTE